MREITAEAITAAVRDLCVDANRVLPADLEALIQQRAQEEGNGTAQSILCDLCRNLDAAREMAIPICQDTGMAVVFAAPASDPASGSVSAKAPRQPPLTAGGMNFLFCSSDPKCSNTWGKIE